MQCCVVITLKDQDVNFATSSNTNQQVINTNQFSTRNRALCLPRIISFALNLVKMMARKIKHVRREQTGPSLVCVHDNIMQSSPESVKQARNHTRSYCIWVIQAGMLQNDGCASKQELLCSCPITKQNSYTARAVSQKSTGGQFRIVQSHFFGLLLSRRAFF